MLQFMPSISTITATMALTLEMSVSVGSKLQHLVTFFTFFLYTYFKSFSSSICSWNRLVSFSLHSISVGRVFCWFTLAHYLCSRLILVNVIAKEKEWLPATLSQGWKNTAKDRPGQSFACACMEAKLS